MLYAEAIARDEQKGCKRPVRESTWLRVGAVCAFAYVLVFLAGQVYLGSQPQATYPHGSSVDEQTRIFLAYAHQHAGLVAIGALMAVVGYLLLCGVMVGIMPALRPGRYRVARIALVVGLLSIAVVLVGVVVEATGLASAAQQFVDAHSAAAQLRVVHDFRNKTLPFQVLDLAGSLGIAVWLALVGLALLRILGRSSTYAWGTIGAGVLAGIGFPVLVAWAAAAGLGLWRLSGVGVPVTPDDPSPPVDAETANQATRSDLMRTGALGARGGKGRRKRRR